MSEPLTPDREQFIKDNAIAHVQELQEFIKRLQSRIRKLERSATCLRKHNKKLQGKC